MKKSKKAAVLLAMIFGFLCFPIGSIAAVAPVTEVPLSIKQSFETKNPAQVMDFTGEYEFRALDGEAPMPNDRKESKYVFSLDGVQAETTLHLRYAHAGVYHYQLVQLTKDKTYYQYDRSCYDITVYVENGKNEELIPQVIVQKEDGKKYGELVFQNIYKGKEIEALQPNHSIGTGDKTDMGMYIFLAISMLLLLMVILFCKKKNRKNEQNDKK